MSETQTTLEWLQKQIDAMRAKVMQLRWNSPDQLVLREKIKDAERYAKRLKKGLVEVAEWKNDRL